MATTAMMTMIIINRTPPPAEPAMMTIGTPSDDDDDDDEEERSTQRLFTIQYYTRGILRCMNGNLLHVAYIIFNTVRFFTFSSLFHPF